MNGLIKNRKNEVLMSNNVVFVWIVVDCVVEVLFFLIFVDEDVGLVRSCRNECSVVDVMKYGIKSNVVNKVRL